VTQVDTPVSHPFASGDTFWALLEDRVRLSPDHPMLLDEHDRSVTFQEFRDWAERVAAGLHQLGIAEGAVVSWQLPTRIETIVFSMALSRLGAVQNPVIALYREREVGALLRTTSARWFAVPGEWKGFDYARMAAALVGQLDQRCDVLDLSGPLPEGDRALLPAPPTDGHLIRWMYATSGTTSEPKAVRHTDASLIAGGIGIATSQRFTPDDIGTIPFPYAHIGGPDNLVMQLRLGFPALLMEAFVPAAAVELMRHHGVTTLGGSTAHYLALLQEQRRTPGVPILPSMRVLVGGGAPKPPELLWQAKHELGVRIHHGYGMTECPMIACCGPDDSDEELADTDGRPVVGCEVRILDDHDVAVTAGIDGEIVVRGPMLTVGYTDAAANAEAFLADGFFRTGDRGHLRESGHLVITGRTKELIIRKGENIAPREIEDVLTTHPSIGAVAVIGLPDAARGERICAVIELRPDAVAPTLADIRELCRVAGLMVQKTPEQIEIVDALPRNPTMKVLKRELVTRFDQGSSGRSRSIS
jgi:cyclohexanecarboxylate-CoA ligase